MDHPNNRDQNGTAIPFEQAQFINPSALQQQPRFDQSLGQSQFQPQHEMHSLADNQISGRQRPFTLDEALPYTPFTSLFPFESDIINNPTIGSGQILPSVAGLVSREDYDVLNREARNPNQSKRLEGSLEYVQNLLKPDSISSFQFKTAPKAKTTSDSSRKSLAHTLSPFARMIYNSTNISFHYPAPTNSSAPTHSADGSSANGQNMVSKIAKRSPKVRKHEPPKVVKHNPAVANAQTAVKNGSRIEIHLPSKKELDANRSLDSTLPSSTPSHPQTISPADLMLAPAPQLQPQEESDSSKQLKVEPDSDYLLKKEDPGLAAASVHSAVEFQPQTHFNAAPPNQTIFTGVPLQVSSTSGISIELPPATFNKVDFAIVDDSQDIPAHLSGKKQKRAELDENENLLDGGLNNRDRAEAALRELQRGVMEIFEAEVMAMRGNHASPWVVISGDQEATMTVTAYNRVLKLMARTVDLGCFRLVPVDDLIHIQNLCDPSLKHTEGMDFKVEHSWGEVEINMWLQQLPDVEAGLKAARTALTVMCGGREEKQLYSEGLIHRGLNLFRSVMDGIITPVSEMRSSSNPTLFKLLSAQRKSISTIFTASQRLFMLMTSMVTSIDLSEQVVNGLEDCSSRLIFVENALTEKDSIVGVQKFDGLRLAAMEMLSQIFVMNPSQRQGILTDILTSLEKLPKAKQNSRQFKLSDGGSIQPVSALIMRLVQASAGKVHGHKSNSSSSIIQTLEGVDANGLDSLPNGADQTSDPLYTVRTEDYAAIQHSTAVQELDALAKPLLDSAVRNASYVINFLVKRAQKSTKTGDTPYRNLLDHIVEDFNTCLDSPDWPAAELLLRITMSLMLELLHGEKTPAPAKNMALELLGNMAAAISKLRSHVRKIATGFEGTDADELGRWLADLTSITLDRRASSEKITSWLGPYRIVLEHLEARAQDDAHLRSAISYFVTDWAVAICGSYDISTQEESEEQDSEYGRMSYRLRNMIEDRRWLTNEYSFNAFVGSHAKLSHSIILLRSPFCDSFKGILNILMQSMTTDAATVRSRSLKSIHSVIETDPSILDGESVVIDLVLQCSNDLSPQVRDSALGLIGKCISIRPHLEEKMTSTVIQRFLDSGIGVRKRAMKLAKDIYLRNQSKQVRSAISNGFLHRTQDPDEGVRELARQMVEEVWISPFYAADDSTAYRQSLTDHVALMVQTVKQGNSSAILEKVLNTILAPESKLVDANMRVSTGLVANMFDLVDNPDSDDSSMPSGKDALQVLMIFAKACPKLFTFEQIRLLKPRIASLGSSEDLASSRAAVVIYRRVLPQVSSMHSQFLADVRKDLMPVVSKVTRALLDDVVACLWIISGLLDTAEHLARLVASSLVGIQKIRAMSVKSPLDSQRIRQFDRYSLIVGMAGKHCNLDKYEDLFKPHFPKWQGNSVSKLMVDILVPFANPSQPADVRKPALDAVGLVCQSNPRNFVAANIYTTFQQAFDEQNPLLESMILRSMKEFLMAEEKRSEQAAASGKDAKDPVKRDLKVMGGTSFDDVASATTQRFLKEITRISLASKDDHAFLAAEVLATINRQGLVHPKETGITFITLETSPVTKISELAYHEHRALHVKHETVIEREYAKAVQSVFNYQRDVCLDVHGATPDPFTSKLHLLIEVLKNSSSGKNRKRFLDKFVGLLEFEPATLDVDQPMPKHVEFTRFLVENLAFFEFVNVAELQSTVSTMEKLVTNTGAGIAQSIESEIFQLRVDTVIGSQQLVDGETQAAAPIDLQIDPQRLRQLTSSAMILLNIWEARTYLRRLYALKANHRDLKAKAPAKDPTKAPTKVPGVTGDKLWEDIENIMKGLESQERMIGTCKSLVELLNVDNEFKVAENDEELDGDNDPRTPEWEDDDEAPNSESRGRKRKAPGNTPGGRKKRARSNSKTRGRGRPRKDSIHDADADFDEDDLITDFV